MNLFLENHFKFKAWTRFIGCELNLSCFESLVTYRFFIQNIQSNKILIIHDPIIQILSILFPFYTYSHKLPQYSLTLVYLWLPFLDDFNISILIEKYNQELENKLGKVNYSKRKEYYYLNTSYTQQIRLNLCFVPSWSSESDGKDSFWPEKWPFSNEALRGEILTPLQPFI